MSFEDFQDGNYGGHLRYRNGMVLAFLSCSDASHQVSVWEEMWFVCVEVLRPSQPNGVMSSAVSLPNHTFYWAGLVLSAVNQYCAHSFARN